MAEQTNAPAVPTAPKQSSPFHDESVTSAIRKTENTKPLPGNQKKSTNKQRKLYAHLLVGLLMILGVVGGYLFFGPASWASAAEPKIYKVGTINQENIITVSIPSQNEIEQINDLATMQAEMDAIMYKLETLQAGNHIFINPDQNRTTISVDQINQMSARMNELIRLANNSLSPSASTANHNH